jgi:superfamily II DNA helicase RecQ
MPTGGGKSLYQLPAYSRRHSNCCFSIDCFDENQVDAIRSLSSESIAHVLNSSLTKTEIAQVKNISSDCWTLWRCHKNGTWTCVGWGMTGLSAP